MMTEALHPDDKQRLREAIEVARMVCNSDHEAIELQARGFDSDRDIEPGDVYREWTEDDAKATTLVRTLSIAINVLAEETPFEAAVAIELTFDTLATAVDGHDEASQS
jgi:hypothetical protein